MSRQAIIIWLCLLLCTTGIAPRVSADALVSTPTQIASTAPLIVTSFRTTSGGKDLSFLELYNAGSTLQKMSDWHITDTVNQRSLTISDRDGFIEPNTHVVVASTNAVANATYAIGSWSTAIINPQVITNIRLTNEKYRPADMQIAAKYIDVWATRSYLTSSYSSSSFEAAYRSLFDDGIYAIPESPQGLRVTEIYPYASNCAPFDMSTLCNDYVKLFNASSSAIDLSDYVLRTDSSSATRTNANTISLVGLLSPGEYLTIATTNTGSKLSLTNSGGYVWVEDSWGLSVFPDTLTRYESAGSSLQGYAYASDVSGVWQWTTTPMPYAENVITPLSTVSCPDGKYLNPDTNRCRTLEETLNTLTACEEGSERNTTTNRCRKVTASTLNTLTPCKEDQVRSPDTNRCRAATNDAAELTPCTAGSERNPETNRCRKTAVAGASSSKYAVEPFGQSGSSSATWWAIAGVVMVVVGYGIWEWRQEIAIFGVKLRSLMTRHKN